MVLVANNETYPGWTKHGHIKAFQPWNLDFVRFITVKLRIPGQIAVAGFAG
jgi:hypothetical protein